MQAGPYQLLFSADEVRNMVSAQSPCRYLCLVSDYLDATNNFSCKIETVRIDSIERAKKLYKSPKEQLDLEQKITQINTKSANAQAIVSTIPSTIIPLYKDIIANCLCDGKWNMAKTYNSGLISMLEGDTEKAISDINTFIDQAILNHKEHLLTSKMLQKKGEVFSEVGLYHKAIEALSEAISKDPKNKEAYFHRASAYFETGNFDYSLQDYLTAKDLDAFVSHSVPLNEIVDIFTKSILEGMQKSANDLIPSLCNSAYGMGQCLWAFGDHPIDSVGVFVNSAIEMCDYTVDYLRTLDRATLHEYGEQLVILLEHYNQLSQKQKAALVGTLIGEYGLDILAGSKVIKAVSTYTKMRDANRICNLESMAMSVASKEAIITEAVTHQAKRVRFFEECKLHVDRQNKHVQGKHNYLEGKSIFEHRDAEGLLKKYAGNGTPKRGELGKPGYQEIVDFNEHVGIWRNKTESLPTTKGTIHYSKDGAHIVPEHPNAKVW